jgi:hypothetical protein
VKTSEMLAAIRRAQDEEALGLQRLIDEGIWSLEGAIGRAMMRAIEEGRCTLGPSPARDYWGNRIPSRSEVVEGSVGSVAYAYRALCAEEVLA